MKKSKRPEPATAHPKFSMGNIVATDMGNYGRIADIKAITTWTSEGPVTLIEYTLYQGQTYSGTFHENRIERVLSES